MSTNALVHSFALDTGYTVWAFIVGRTSGPRRMSISIEGPQDIGILVQETVFPIGASIHRLHVRADSRDYCLYFDKIGHKDDHDNATYVFLCFQNGYNGKKFINICVEDDMPYLLEVWLR